MDIEDRLARAARAIAKHGPCAAEAVRRILTLDTSSSCLAMCGIIRAATVLAFPADMPERASKIDSISYELASLAEDLMRNDQWPLKP